LQPGASFAAGARTRPKPLHHARKLLLREAATGVCFGMDWQQGVAMLVVLTTAGLFVRCWRRPRSAVSVCPSQCGCAGAETPKVRVTYRARKGERPQIITRMS